MARKRIGTIIVPPGVIVAKQEKIAVDYLAARLGYNVTFLLPDRRKGRKTPDIQMLKLLWEIKSPKGKRTRTIENNVRQALRQSPNIILDLRRMDGRIPTKKLVDEVKRQFTLTRPVKRIIVITLQEEHIDFKR